MPESLGLLEPLTSSSGMVRSVAPWATFAGVIAAIAGVVLGGSLWMVRNARSDDAMFAAVAATNDSAGYRAYLERGTRHSDEVASVLLPRALLAEAVKIGSVDAQFLGGNGQLDGLQERVRRRAGL